MTEIPIAFDRLPIGLCQLDRDLRITSLNRMLAIMTSLPNRVDFGRTIADLLPSLFVQIEQGLQRALAGEPVEEIEVWGNPDPLGGGRTFLVSLQPTRTNNDTCGSILISMLDISRQKRAETALQESKDHFRYMVELNPQTPWTADPDGGILEASPRWLSLTGMTCGQTLGAGWTKALHPDDFDSAIGAWSHSLRSGDPLDVEYRLRLLDGTYRWSRARAVARRNAEGHIVRWYGSFEDIHDRKLAEKALAARTREFEEAQRIAKLGSWTWKVGTQEFAWSDELYRIAGRDPATFQPTLDNTFACLHLEDREPTMQRLLQAVLDKANYDHEFRVVRPDGSVRQCWAEVQPEMDADGAVILVRGICQDITSRKLTEEALRESEEHYRYSVELSPHIPWIADPNGEVLDVSQRGLALSGLEREAVLGTGWISAFHPEDRPQLERIWAAALRSGEPADIECRLHLADGSYRWVRSRAAPRHDAEGRILRWYGTIEDIHDRRMAEDLLRQSEAFARSVLDNSPDCVTVADLDGRLLFMNGPGLCAMEIDDFTFFRGQVWDNLWSPDDAARIRHAFEDAKAGRTARFTGFCPTAKGAPKWWDVSISPIPGPDGRAARLLSVSRDVTEAKRVQDEIERVRSEAQIAAERLSAVLESTTDGVVLLDRDWRITYINQRVATLLSETELSIGTPLLDVFPENVAGRLCWHFRRALAEQVPVDFEEYLQSRDLWLNAHAYPTSDGGLSVFFRNVTEQRKMDHEQLLAQERIAHLARHDTLTGLPNRAHLRERLDQSLSKKPETGETAVLYLDLDGFKAVNDTFGHPAGDVLLRQVADRLRRCMRQSDMVARFGGDEFAVIELALDQPAAAASLAQRIIAAIGEPYDLDGQPVVIGTSIGIALAAGNGGGADDLLKQADLALYAAKSAGRGTFRFFETRMGDELRDKESLKADLRLAVLGSRFELNYQPILDLRTNRITCFEALLRWRHSEHRLVPPSEFIPLAEETALIQPIGEWALYEACREAAKWPESMGIAVNLSPVQFRSPDLVRNVTRAIAGAGLGPDRLELEITESVLLQDSDAHLAILRDLKQLGIRIALDDFGTGYSSLAYLRRFPFDKIKIDRSFINDLPSGGESTAIVRAVLGLGADLGVKITAEGVETQAQLDYLRAEGCDQGQGYLFSKPVGSGEVAAVIRRLTMVPSMLSASEFLPRVSR